VTKGRHCLCVPPRHRGHEVAARHNQLWALLVGPKDRGIRARLVASADRSVRPAE